MTTFTVRGMQAFFERAGPLFHARHTEFVCAAQDLSTWAATRPTDPPPPTPNGTRVCKLYTPEALDSETSAAHLLQAARRGAEVRICTTPLPRETIVIDRRLAITAGPPRAGERDYTLTQDEGIIQSFLGLYWAVWDRSPTLDAFRRDRPIVLTEESRAILRLLAQGRKDETAARSLGLSLRTYRRRVAEILTLLDADSRFQAGRRAQELGLIR